MEYLSEEERYDAGVIPHDLYIPLAEVAFKDLFESPTLTDDE